MKKMILAPAVALAFTGLVAAPVAAAEPAPAEAPASASAKAPAAKSADAAPASTPKTTEAAPAEKPEAEAPKKTEAPKTETPKKTEKPAEKPATKAPAAPKTTAPAPEAKTPTKTTKAAPAPQAAPIEATMTVDPKAITAEDLASKGVQITITGVKTGDTTTDSLSNDTDTVKTDGTYVGQITYTGDPSNLKEGPVDFTVTVERAGEDPQTLSGQFEVVAEAPAADPKLTGPATVTETEINDKGIAFSGTGFRPNEDVKVSLPVPESSAEYGSTTVTADGDGAISGTVTVTDNGPVTAGDYIVVARQAASDAGPAATAQFELTVTEDEAPEFAPEASLSPEKLTQSQFTDAKPWTDESKGVTILITGLQPGDYVHNEDPFSNQYDTVTESDSGQLQYRMYNNNGNPADVTPGIHKFNITVDRKDENGDVQTKTLPLQYEIIADDAQTVDPTIKVDDSTFTVSEFKDSGVTITGEGFTPGGTVTLVGGGAQSPFDYIEVTADKDGKVVGDLKSPKDGLNPGKYEVWAYDQASDTNSNYVAITISEDEAPAEASLTVTPKKLEAGDFINEKKGVTLTVKDYKPGEDVRFQVNPKGLKVTAYDRTVQADKNGGASVTVYGTSTDSSAYVGDYTVTATCGEDTLKGAFTVTSAAKGGGDDGNDDTDKGDNSNDDDTTTVTPGSDLPRTGTDLGGLTAGALLLLVGGAVVTLTGRRKKMSSDPSEI